MQVHVHRNERALVLGICLAQAVQCWAKQSCAVNMQLVVVTNPGRLFVCSGTLEKQKNANSLSSKRVSWAPLPKLGSEAATQEQSQVEV